MANEVKLEISIKPIAFGAGGRFLLENYLLATGIKKSTLAKICFTTGIDTGYLEQLQGQKGQQPLEKKTTTAKKKAVKPTAAASLRAQSWRDCDDSLYWLSVMGLVTLVVIKDGDAPSAASAGAQRMPLTLDKLTSLLSIVFLSHYAGLYPGAAPKLIEEIFSAVGKNREEPQLLQTLTLVRTLTLAAYFMTSGVGVYGSLSGAYSVLNGLLSFSPKAGADLSMEERLKLSVGKHLVSASQPVDAAPASAGSTATERTIVLQLKREHIETNRFQDFLIRFSGKGVYMRPARPDSTFTKRLIKIMRDSFKLGYVEFAIEVDQGVETKHLIELLFSSGGLKRRGIHHTEYGFHRGATESSLRYSEWLHLSGTSYQELGGIRSERIPKPIARANKIL